MQIRNDLPGRIQIWIPITRQVGTDPQHSRPLSRPKKGYHNNSVFLADIENILVLGLATGCELHFRKTKHTPLQSFFQDKSNDRSQLILFDQRCKFRFFDQFCKHLRAVAIERL